MLKKSYYAIAAATAIILAAAVFAFRGKDVSLIGKYRTFLSDAIDEDDGMVCTVNIATTQDLNPTGVNINANVGMTFHFGGALEFDDVQLRYLMRLNGDWHVSDDNLSMKPDTASFSYAYVGSSAKNNVEDAMARQLMKFVDVSIVPKLRRKIIEANGRPLRIRYRTRGGVIGQDADRYVVMISQ